MPVKITKNKDDINNGPTDCLPKKKTKNGYIYDLIDRNEKAAIYSQKNEKFPEDTSTGYEVFKINITHPCSIKQNNGTNKGMWYQYPSTEKFPGNEDFGKTAWAYRNLKSARNKFNELSK